MSRVVGLDVFQFSGGIRCELGDFYNFVLLTLMAWASDMLK
jgi:hypothetical protein